MGIAKKYPMLFKSLDEWGNDLLNQLDTDIEEITNIVEIDEFWNKMRDFKNNLDEEGALNWIAKTFGYQSAGAMIDAQLDSYNQYCNIEDD